MKNKISVSVIIPVYNVEKYLEECLDSIINQTLKDIEIICVNDGSTDHSSEILDAYSQKDLRIKIIKQRNQGQSVARNQGLEWAHGEYIYFMDSDDYLETDALEILYQTIKRKALDILYFDAESFFEAINLERKFNGQEYYYRDREYGGIYSGQRLFQLMKQNNEYRVSPCLQIIKRSFLQEIGIAFFEGIIYEDNLFTMLTLLQAKKVSHINRPFYKRRWHGKSTTGGAITFKNVYGYFTVYVQMLIFFTTHPEFESETQKWIINELKRILQSVKSYYQNLNVDEKNEISNMNECEQYLFALLVFVPQQNSMQNTTRPFARTSRKIKNAISCYREHGLRYTLCKVYDQFKK